MPGQSQGRGPPSREQVGRRLKNMPRSPRTITPRRFRNEGTVQVNTASERSEVARLPADTVLKLRQDRPFRLSIPAFDSFTSDGTGGNTETFSLSNDVIQSPNTENAIVWIGGSFYGNPDSVDYANNTVDVTDPGTGNNVYVWYIPGDSAEVELRKETSQAGSEGAQSLYESNLNLVHGTDQNKSPERLSLDESALQEWVPVDMRLKVYVDAPYTVRFEDPNGDGATPNNMLLHIPTFEGRGEVDGLGRLVRQDM